MAFTYIEAIGKGFPNVQCHVVGETNLYEDIVWDAGAPLPDKSTLDQWILSNPNSTTNVRKITILAFRNRFTKTEKISMELASIDNPTGTTQARQLAASLRVDMKDSDSALYIDLNRTDTRAGVQALETYGLIGPGRAAIILDNPILDHEVPLLY